jgi:hypothetical protein
LHGDVDGEKKTRVVRIEEKDMILDRDKGVQSSVRVALKQASPTLGRSAQIPWKNRNPNESNSWAGSLLDWRAKSL